VAACGVSGGAEYVPFTVTLDTLIAMPHTRMKPSGGFWNPALSTVDVSVPLSARIYSIV
jgi:hypothetical protein